MKCPKCGGEQYCPCKNCAEKNKDKVTWIWKTGNGPIECGHCGHIMDMGTWYKLEYEDFEKFREEQGERR